jgi:hypothetical protein
MLLIVKVKLYACHDSYYSYDSGKAKTAKASLLTPDRINKIRTRERHQKVQQYSWQERQPVYCERY